MTTPEQLIEDQKVIDSLERQELDMLKELNEKRDEIKKLKADYWLKSKGLEMNNAVQFKTGWGVGEKTLSGKLIDFHFAGTNPVQPKVLLFNVNGQLGKVTRILSKKEFESMIKI